MTSKNSKVIKIKESASGFVFFYFLLALVFYVFPLMPERKSVAVS